MRAILPILNAANPALNLSLEMAASCVDKPRAKNPRQCIQIDDPVWRAVHPDLTAEEYEAYMAMIDAYETRVASGEIEDWAAYEARNYGYPSYQTQSYAFEGAIAYIRKSAAHIRKTCAEAGISLEVQKSTPAELAH